MISARFTYDDGRFSHRYCLRDSIEEATIALHAKIKEGEIRLVDGTFPPQAYELFKRCVGEVGEVGEAPRVIRRG
jgi:hypothetical protein